MSDEWVYTLSLEMDRAQLRVFYFTLDRAYKNWAGGEAIEQELLKYMRDEAWKILMEEQFRDSPD